MDILGVDLPAAVTPDEVAHPEDTDGVEIEAANGVGAADFAERVGVDAGAGAVYVVRDAVAELGDFEEHGRVGPCFVALRRDFAGFELVGELVVVGTRAKKKG